MITNIAVPVATGVLRLQAEKGRQWSPIEHLVLHVLCKQPQGARNLALVCSLPVRVVIEILIRLMRVGWVHLKHDRLGVVFSATPAGLKVAAQEKLPAHTRLVRRRAGFAYDLLTGAAFRSRDLTLYSKGRLEELRKDTEVVVLEAGDLPPFRIQEVINRLLDEDEEFKSIEPSAERLVDKFALVSVVGETVDELPSYAPEALREKVLKAAGRPGAVRPDQPQAEVASPPYVVASNWLQVTTTTDDLIVGGERHRQLVQAAIRAARIRLVIHSTFISSDTFADFAPLMHDAIKRGVQVDIFYGLDTEGIRSSRAEEIRDVIARCRSCLSQEIAEQISFHPHSTASHSKILIYDNGKGEFFGVVGSCNWLSSGFGSFEVSLQCRDPRLVAQLLDVLGEMDQGPSGRWTAFTREMAALAQQLRKREPKKGPRATACLVFGAEHNQFVRKARDEAKDKIVIASHRISSKARTQILYPAEAATRDGKVAVTLYYGRVDEGGQAIVATKLREGDESSSIRFREIHEPRMHAKFLAWDRDSIVVSSQNWLSADPGENSPYSEVGIFLSGHGFAKELIEASERAFGK